MGIEFADSAYQRGKIAFKVGVFVMIQIEAEVFKPMDEREKFLAEIFAVDVLSPRRRESEESLSVSDTNAKSCLTPKNFGLDTNSKGC